MQFGHPCGGSELVFARSREQKVLVGSRLASNPPGLGGLGQDRVEFSKATSTRRTSIEDGQTRKPRDFVQTAIDRLEPIYRNSQRVGPFASEFKFRPNDLGAIRKDRTALEQLDHKAGGAGPLPFGLLGLSIPQNSSESVDRCVDDLPVDIELNFAVFDLLD